MNLPAFCIRRPAFTLVISLIIVLIGLIGFMNLPVRWIPNINLPEVTIATTYPGANARLVEHDVTKVIEDSLSGINGVDKLTSTSRQGESHITVVFKLNRNLDAATEDVRSSVERIRAYLPKDVNNPVVMKSDSNNMPVLFLSFTDVAHDERAMSDYIDKYVVPRFETIDGVGSVWVYGKRVSSVRIRLDPVKMAAANVTVDEITQRLKDENVSTPNGQIRSHDRFYSILTDTSLKSIEQFNNFIIHNAANQMVRLKDIGEAKIEALDVDSAFRINGKSAIALGIVPQSIANPLDIEKTAKYVLQDIKKTLPQGMTVSIDYNQADYIRASLYSVYESLFEAMIFVWLVILIFLGSFRATMIPVITIPVCLVGTFAILYFFGFSINTITLMAFVLAIGLVVDDAIVMLENISRHISNGLNALTAALRGSKEMIFPILAMTFTLTAVYAPIAFTPGLLGVIFREFTFTLAGAVIISGCIALTLTPMMCARILKKDSKVGPYHHFLTHQLNHMQHGYERLLNYLLVRRKWVMLSLLIIGILGFFVYLSLPSEFAPTEDMDEINVYIAAPRSASFQYTDTYVQQLETLYKNMNDVESYFSEVGTYSPARSYQIIKLKPKSERNYNINAMVQRINLATQAISGVRIHVSAPPPALAEYTNMDQGDRIGLVLMTAGDYRELQQLSQRMIDVIKQIPGFIHVDNSLKWDGEQFQINIDRERAADLKVSIPSITNTLSTLIAGKNIGKMDYLNIIVQARAKDLSDPNIFQKLYIKNSDGDMLPLSSMLSVQEITMPEVFRHDERLRSDTIYVTLAPDFKLADAIQLLETIAKKNLPEDMKYSFTGEAKSFLESQGKMIFTFILALVFIYLVLVAQFESFIDPLIIMLTVPFAMVGAMTTLKLFGGSLNIYSHIGLITLIGLITKHGILITEFANRKREEGYTVLDAVLQAALLRLRPILMTTAAMVLGALPLALAFGPGAESRQQIGLVITGGLLLGTFFSLIVIPITYTYLSPFKKLTSSHQDQESEYATLI